MVYTGGTHIPHLVSMVLPQGIAGSSLLEPVPWTEIGAIYGKYVLVSIMFSHRPDEAISVGIWQKLV